MRKTKIVCTIGPASQGEEKLRELMRAGMNVARFNFSHGDHEEQKGKFDNVVKISKELGVSVATLQDTRGPEIRLMKFEEGKVNLVAGQKFILTTTEVMGNSEKAAVNYKNLINDVNVGAKILIDDGLVEMTIEKIEGTEIFCKVENDGTIGDKKGVNLPGANLSMPFIGESDKKDILFGIETGFDFIATSFTRTKEDVLEVRQMLTEHKSPMKIIAKIENMQGIENLDEIIDAADGIMVARGDMGVEVPIEDVPAIQKLMIKKAVAKGKHVITATQMLDSMMKNPRPTRAETTDVANAIYDGTTAIMLSGETANGKYPLEALETMVRIAEKTEKEIDYTGRMKKREDFPDVDITSAISHATCTIAADLKAAAIITVTMTGFTAGMIARYKPDSLIIGCTIDETVYRQSSMMWGVAPLYIAKKETSEELYQEAIIAAKNAGLIKVGDTVVLTAGVPLGIAGNTNMVRVVEIK